MKTLLKKSITLLLVMLLAISSFAACEKQKSNNDTDYEDIFITEEEQQNEQKPTETPWIVDVLKETDSKTRILPYSEGLAFVSFNNQSQFIDKTGNVKFTVDSYNSTENMAFKNGLLMAWEDKLMTIEGEMIDVQKFEGTAFQNISFAMELLEAGYFVVEKVSTGYDGATYESAIYNAKFEQVQPYSKELYTFLAEDFSYFTVYNGYIIRDDTETYHIETGTYGEYKDLTLVNKMDFACFSIPSDEERGMYRNEEKLLDLSAYETLCSVNFTGDKGLAIFENEENECFFTIMDEEGKFQFEPICFAETRGRYHCQLNGDVIQAYGVLSERQNGKQVMRISTYDLNGNLLGFADVVDQSSFGLIIYLGSDSIVVDNENVFTYYDINLKPMFSAE